MLAEYLREYRENKYDSDNHSHHDKNRDMQNEFDIESEPPLPPSAHAHHRALALSESANKFFAAAGFEPCAMQLATISNTAGDLEAEVTTSRTCQLFAAQPCMHGERAVVQGIDMRNPGKFYMSPGQHNQRLLMCSKEGMSLPTAGRHPGVRLCCGGAGTSELIHLTLWDDVEHAHTDTLTQALPASPYRVLSYGYR